MNSDAAGLETDSKGWLSKLQRVTTSGRIIPEIDGFRFIAIFVVVLHHDIGQIMAKNNIAKLPNKSIDIHQLTGFDWLLATILEQGNFGVPLFFVISGFILAVPFAEHYLVSARKPSLASFYLRRVTRLEPPYILSLLFWLPFACYLNILVNGVPAITMAESFGASVVYLHNHLFEGFSLINPVAWSLEIEVQFYLIAPFLAVLFAIRFPILRRTLLVVGVIGGAYFNQYYAVKSTHYYLSILYYIQYFLGGFLLAEIYILWLKKSQTRNIYWDFAALALSTYLLLSLINAWPKTLQPIAVVFLYVCGFKGTFFNRAMRWKPLWIIGGMCYSIYLMHYHILAIAAYLTKPMYITSMPLWVNFLIQGSVHCLLVMIVSSAFFVFIERPCMKKDWPRRFFNFLFPPQSGYPDSPRVKIRESGGDS